MISPTILFPTHKQTCIIASLMFNIYELKLFFEEMDTKQRMLTQCRNPQTRHLFHH